MRTKLVDIEKDLLKAAAMEYTDLLGIAAESIAAAVVLDPAGFGDFENNFHTFRVDE